MPASITFQAKGGMNVQITAAMTLRYGLKSAESFAQFQLRHLLDQSPYSRPVNIMLRPVFIAASLKYTSGLAN